MIATNEGLHNEFRLFYIRYPQPWPPSLVRPLFYDRGIWVEDCKCLSLTRTVTNMFSLIQPLYTRTSLWPLSRIIRLMSEHKHSSSKQRTKWGLDGKVGSGGHSSETHNMPTKFKSKCGGRLVRLIWLAGWLADLVCSGAQEGGRGAGRRDGGAHHLHRGWALQPGSALQQAVSQFPLLPIRFNFSPHFGINKCALCVCVGARACVRVWFYSLVSTSHRSYVDVWKVESCVRCTVSSEVIASSSLCGERKQVESRLKAPFTVTETCRETLPTRWLALFLMVSIFCSTAPRCLSKCSCGMLKLQRNLCGPINIFFVTFHHFVVDKLIIVTFVLSLILLSLLDIYLPVVFFILFW